jgi:hypothetical protein
MTKHLKLLVSSTLVAITFSVARPIHAMDYEQEDPLEVRLHNWSIEEGLAPCSDTDEPGQKVHIHQLDEGNSVPLSPESLKRESLTAVKQEIWALKEENINECINIYEVLKKSTLASRLENCSIDIKKIYNGLLRGLEGLVSHFNSHDLAAIKVIKEQKHQALETIQTNEEVLRRFYEERYSGTLRTQIPKKGEMVPANSYQDRRGQLALLIKRDIMESMNLYFELHKVTYPGWNHFSQLDQEKACCVIS